MTEISKALIGRVRVLVLDEPTSALTSDEEQILFDAVRAVIAQGVGVMYVTHRLNEVFRISHSVTVLRDGVNVGTFNTAETDMKTLVAAIVGPKLAVAERAPRRSRARSPN
jgi:ribose transport system ATP-binding protein